MAEKYRIGVVQRGARLTISSPVHPACTASFLVNEVVTPAHFTPQVCEAFRDRVMDIWGPGGRRSAIERRPDGKPQDAHGYWPWDGKLGKFPDSRIPEE